MYYNLPSILPLPFLFLPFLSRANSESEHPKHVTRVASLRMCSIHMYLTRPLFPPTIFPTSRVTDESMKKQQKHTLSKYTLRAQHLLLINTRNISYFDQPYNSVLFSSSFFSNTNHVRSFVRSSVTTGATECTFPALLLGAYIHTYNCT